MPGHGRRGMRESQSEKGFILTDEASVELELERLLPGTRETLARLLSFDTSPEGADHEACTRWLEGRLSALGFDCQLHRPIDKAPALLEAHRPARGMGGHVVMYGHYDVTSYPHGAHDGATPPPVLFERNGRWWGKGVSDNKGALTARLVALGLIEDTPALTWFIQGEEETGSSAARRIMGTRLPGIEADLWLDETGYHDHEDGTLRLIARKIGTERTGSEPPDVALQALIDSLGQLAGRWGIHARLEVRGLNKAAVFGGCPFNQNLPVGARYFALGVNDSHSRIHDANESVPLWTFPLHAEELRTVFQWLKQLPSWGA
ncbi:MAG: M20/M25/M40 family metallo-hydrolase [Myxococcaceae bacterium]|nr:MAG: M20/M25/M40 family metallo-hydrolase [Myxococcaceae bacterium]